MEQQQKDELKTLLIQYVNACIRQEPKQIKSARKAVEDMFDRHTDDVQFDLADPPTKAIIARAVFDWIESTHLDQIK